MGSFGDRIYIVLRQRVSLKSVKVIAVNLLLKLCRGRIWESLPCLGFGQTGLGLYRVTAIRVPELSSARKLADKVLEIIHDDVILTRNSTAARKKTRLKYQVKAAV